MKTGRPKKKVTHRDVCRAVQGIGRHLREGDQAGAKRYTWHLLILLDHLNLLPGSLESVHPIGQGNTSNASPVSDGPIDKKEG